MIIGIDMYAQHIFKTGIKIVIDNLLASWKKNYPEHTFIELHPKSLPLSTSRHSYDRKIYNHLHRTLWTQVGLPRQAKEKGCDILFCPCYFSPFIQQIPTVTLIYDMAIWRHPNWYNKLWYIANKVFTEIPARSNAHILTISEDARQDIIKFFALPPEKVTMAHLGIDLPAVPLGNDTEVLKEYGLNEQSRYIFYLGPLIKHKNIHGLVEAFSELIKQLPDPNIKLVIGGPSSNTHGKDHVGTIKEIITRNSIQDRVIFTGFMPREHCSILFRNAALYAFPSFFEGFGLPMVEAMASGIPIAASNLTSLPEIGEKAAIYFDPYNLADVTDKLYIGLTNQELREQMIAEGKERAKLFTWDNTANTYMKVFEQIYSAR